MFSNGTIIFAEKRTILLDVFQCGGRYVAIAIAPIAGHWILSNGFGLNSSNPGLHWTSSNRIQQKCPNSKKIGDLIGCFPMERSYLKKNGRFYWTFSNAVAVMWLLPLRLLRPLDFIQWFLA
ncbi:hypothetical protein [Paenibacillus sp. CECT 9249]|uniref:hypothetical protein n=1 Tax=Paenibacillus sp. CECT 9249 TaxID=2845385 RepID=UPI001E50AA17|nr:hypothetical protein [Paenibacillus sp. CECT 9249]